MKRRVDFTDLTGKTFGDLTVGSFAFTKKRVAHWNCICKCGKKRIVRSYYLTHGLRTACESCTKIKNNGHHYVDVTGMRFGKLTVLHVSHFNRKNRQYYWRCLCDCGRETVVQGCPLRTGKTRSCGCLVIEKAKNRGYVDLTNKRFGRLVVKSHNGMRGNFRYWECVCDCGNITKVKARDLKSGHSQSCGCLRNERASEGCKKRRLPDNEAGFNRIFSEYKTKNAERRDLPFDLTRCQFRELINKNCHYCGAPLLKEQQGYKYNGIDRIDNTKGYSISNVVPCCFYVIRLNLL